jgi:hypothetical protein
MGRPKKYKTPELMQIAVDKYFEEHKECLSICELALELGFVDRQSLFDYEGYGKEFSCVVKRAKTGIEASWERQLRKQNSSGAIFALKQYKWSDKLELTGKDGKDLQPMNITVQPEKEGKPPKIRKFGG